MFLFVGLGTRAVDPHPDDYTRIVALNEPDMELCEIGENGVREFTKPRLRNHPSRSTHSQEIHRSSSLGRQMRWGMRPRDGVSLDAHVSLWLRRVETSHAPPRHTSGFKRSNPKR